MSFSSEIKDELRELKNEKNEKKDFLRRVFLLDGYIANPERVIGKGKTLKLDTVFPFPSNTWLV